MNNLFLAKVRADEQSIFFTIVSVSKILLMTGIIIYMVGFLGKGIEGYLYAVVIAEFFGLVVLLPRIIPEMKIKFERNANA